MMTGSISDAARHLNVSQPNVSNILRHTEDRLGIRLFERTKGRLYPTDEAKALYAEVEKVYHHVKMVHDLAEDLSESRIGRLRIACNPSLGISLVPAAIAAFRADRPKVHVQMRIAPQKDLIELVLTHQIDVGISIFPTDHPNITTETLGRGRLVCALPEDHPLTALSIVRPADLSSHSLISYERDSQQGRMVDAAFQAAGITRDSMIDLSYGYTACALVEAGAGVALVDEFTLSGGSFPRIVTRPFEPVTEFVICAFRDRLRPLSIPTEAFLTELRRVVSQTAN